MPSNPRPLAALLLVPLLVLCISIDAAAARRNKKDKPKANPIVEFIKQNGIDLSKPVKAVRISGSASTEDGPRAVMKVFAIKDIRKESHETENDARLREYVEETNKVNKAIIVRLVTFVREGRVIDSGKTTKVADLDIYMEDGSSFLVRVGEDFSHIIFEKVVWKPKNPFSSDPVKKERKVLSFVSPDLTKAIKLILVPQDKSE